MPSRNPLATSSQRVLDQRALALWQAGGFSASMESARAAFLSGYGGQPDAQSLVRLDNAISEFAFGMVQTVINGDPFRPRVYWVATGPHSWFGLNLPGSRWVFDNPDTIYRTIPIDPASHYVIHGALRGAGVIDQAFSLVSNLLTQNIAGYVDGIPLRSPASPDYTVTVGPEPADGRPNHIQTTSDCVQLFIRSTLGDWSRDLPDQLRVERTDSGSLPPAPTPSQMTDQVNELITTGGIDFGVGLMGYRVMAPPANTFPAPTAAGIGLSTQYNTFGHFALEPGQGLLVTVDPAGAGYITTPATDPWMLTVDPRRHQVSLNSSQAYRSADGTYAFVISATDPGILNWLSTVGWSDGTVMARWQRPPATLSTSPAIETQVVDLDSLDAVLPDGMPLVSPGKRQQALVRRAREYDRRFTT